MTVKLVALLSLLGTALAQSISSQCQSAILSLVGNSDLNQCLALSQLVTGVVGLQSDESIIPALLTWQTSLCAAPACDNQTLSDAAGTLASACASNLGISSSIADQVHQYAPEAVYGIKNLLCLKDAQNTTASSTRTSTCASGGSFCSDALLQNIEQANNVVLSLNTLQSLLQGGVVSQLGSYLNELSTTQACTQCNVALYQTANSTLSSFGVDLDSAQVNGQTLPTAFDAKCGADFAQTAYSTNDVSTPEEYCSSNGSTSRLRYARWA